MNSAILATILSWPHAPGFVGYQGIAVDNDHVFLLDSTNDLQQKGHSTIRKYTKEGELVASRTDCHNDSAYMTSLWHGFGDGNIIGGRLYITAMENSSGNPPWGDSVVMVYDPGSLSFIEEFLLTGHAGVEGVDKHDGDFWMVLWKSDIVERYSSNFEFLGSYNLSHRVDGLGEQTIVWDGDYILVHGHGAAIDRYLWTGSGFEFVEEIGVEFYEDYPGEEWVPLAKGISDEADVYWFPSWTLNRTFKAQLIGSVVPPPPKPRWIIGGVAAVIAVVAVVVARGRGGSRG